MSRRAPSAPGAGVLSAPRGGPMSGPAGDGPWRGRVTSAPSHRAEVFEGGGPLWFDLEEREIAGLPAPPSPEERLSQAETQADTEVDFAALSRSTKPARWRAFYAHVVLGVPVARIAAAERTPAPTIYTRIRQAREDLRAAITRQRAARRR